ncbi:MAG: hypothetical protein RRA45_09235 [Saccharolobus sp.]|uniref:hypothetical protein n=1 Tax=Saccharolobus sp. TaxID=2100761 RepID=UPI0028CD887F|nr:hypothetical protein [Saccharolobus sp.]MDT7862382.1 hypothetical protein [Saccharolobus sp.]
MRRKTAFIIFLLFLTLSIIDLIFTYFYTSLVIYSIKNNILLSEDAEQSVYINVKAYDTIIIKGNSTKPINIYVQSFIPINLKNNVTSFKISYISPISGPLYVQFRTLPYTNLTKISFEIFVVNSWFSGIGYLIFIFLLIISLIFLGYYRMLSRRKRP